MENNMEDAGIDPATSRMLSERSTIWANPPTGSLFVLGSVFNRTFKKDWRMFLAFIMLEEKPMDILANFNIVKVPWHATRCGGHYITSWCVHLDVGWIDQSTNLPSGLSQTLLVYPWTRPPVMS